MREHPANLLPCALAALILVIPAMCPAARSPATATRSSRQETEEDFIGDIDSVISATRIRQPLTESPSSVTIIDRDMIEASGAIEIADVLRLVPGIQVAYPQGNQLAVTYHGFGDAFPRSMQVLVDGRSIYQPSFADIDWVMLGITLEDIERIEVIRGPNSPLYGSNAVAGVINIITRPPLQTENTLVQATAGSLKTQNGLLQHTGKSGDLDYRLTLNYQKDNGFPGNFDSTNDSRRIGGGNLRAIWYPHPQDEVNLQLGYTAGNLGAGSEINPFPKPHNKYVSSDYEFASWRRTLADAADIRWQFYRNAYRSDDRYRNTIASEFDYPDPAVQELLGVGPGETATFGTYDYAGERYDTELQYTSPLSRRLRTVAGIGLRMDRLQSPRLTNRNDWIDEVSERLFVNLNYSATRNVLLNLGMIGENSDEFGAYLSPRIALNWTFLGNHGLRISHARAKRMPSLLENHFDTVQKLDDGTPFLISYLTRNTRPETVTSTEVGLVSYWLDRRLLLDVKGFRERTDDIIHFANDQSLSQLYGIPISIDVVVNDGYRVLHGVDLQLKFKTAPRDFVSLQYSNVDEDVVYHSKINPDFLKFNTEDIIPHDTFSLLVSKSLPWGFEISGAYYYLSKMVWLESGDRLNKSNRVDARVARHWRCGGSRLTLEAIGQNLGKSHPSFRDENLFETRVYLRLTVAFN